MTHLWILRHDGDVIACAPSRLLNDEHDPDVAYDDGAYRALDQAWNTVDVQSLRNLIDANDLLTRYEHNGYTLALEPHPTPGGA